MTGVHHHEFIKRRLVDVTFSISPSVSYWYRDDARADALKREARDMEEFLRDHRRLDNCVQRTDVYETTCMFCGTEPEAWMYKKDLPNGYPACCGEAQDAWIGSRLNTALTESPE